MENEKKEIENSKSLELAKAFLGKTITVTIDRPLNSLHPKYGFKYEANYGYLEGITAPDGEDLDAYFLGITKPVEKGSGLCIAIVHRKDNDDDKLVVVPAGIEMTDEEIMKAVHFQEQWFDSELLR